MLVVDEIGKIPRAHFREGRSIKGTSRDMSVSRAAVRKVLRPRATAVYQLLREGTGVLESPYCQGQFASLRHEVQLMGPVLFRAGLKRWLLKPVARRANCKSRNRDKCA